MKRIFYVGKASGISMMPLIVAGDKLFVEKVNFQDVHIGDILVFNKNSKFIGHRVAFKIGQKIITKGDNVYWTDGTVRPKDVLGRLAVVKHKDGKTIRFDTFKARIISFYFLFYSLITVYPPRILYKILRTVFRGRRFLTKFLVS